MTPAQGGRARQRQGIIPPPSWDNHFQHPHRAPRPSKAPYPCVSSVDGRTFYVEAAIMRQNLLFVQDMFAFAGFFPGRTTTTTTTTTTRTTRLFAGVKGGERTCWDHILSKQLNNLRSPVQQVEVEHF